MGSWLTAAAANGLVAVAMGAFAAHGLRSVLDAEALGWVETASRYQMWHALALFGVALLFGRAQPVRDRRLLTAVAWPSSPAPLFSPEVSTSLRSRAFAPLLGSRPSEASS